METTATKLFLLDIVSCSMYGFNQGGETVCDLIDNYNPDVFLLQEHWLTPHNLSNFDFFLTILRLAVLLCLSQSKGVYDLVITLARAYVNCNIIVGGDINVNLDITDDVANS